MTTVTTFDELAEILGNRRSALTIGVFDGVHLGHQVLVERTIASARENCDVSVVLTFRDHPLSVLAPPYTPRRIITPARKANLLLAMGIDVVVMMDFTPELAATEPERFVTEFLVKKAALRTLFCGYDFTFGARGKGNLGLLQALGESYGFGVERVAAVSHDNRVVKSTHVRDLLFAGHVSETAQLLSRPHEVPGVVGSGMQRGRTIGFPTANLECPPDYQVPAHGVYLCGARIEMEDTVRPAMVNIGTSPTFGENRQTVEAHLLNFEGELVGRHLTLYFIERLRDERKFPGIEALVEQLGKDREQSNLLWKSQTIQQMLSLIPAPVDHQLKVVR